MDINNLSGHEFEDLIEKLIRKMGFTIDERKKSFDGGIDLKATNETPILKGLYIIQCKRNQKPVGESIIRDLYGVVSSERANKGILITNSSFTSSAKSFSSNKPIELIDGISLQELIKKYLSEEYITKEKNINVPQKYQILYDLIGREFAKYENKHKRIVDGEAKISLIKYEDKNHFVAYCGIKSAKLSEITNQFANRFREIISLLNNLSEKELDYIEINQLKSKIHDFYLSFDDIEKEWIDVLSTLPPDGLRELHKSLIQIYETFRESVSEFIDSLSLTLNTWTSSDQLDEENLTVRLTFLINGKYIDIFGEKLTATIREIRKEKLQQSIPYIIYKKLFS